MAKRGETRPWRVRYEWENGVKGCETFSDEWRAEACADEIRRAAEHRDLSVSITIEHRDEPQRKVVSVAPTRGV